MCATSWEEVHLCDNGSFHSTWEFRDVLGIGHYIERHRVMRLQVATEEVEGLFILSFGDIGEEEAC